MTQPNIVKVQQSIRTSHDKPTMLIYNEGQGMRFQSELTDEVAELLNGRLKAYFYSEIGDEGILTLKDEAPEQDW
ncbi:MAG: hypothetical protein V3W37_02985 [Candidatus Binatia bacterium]